MLSRITPASNGQGLSKQAFDCGSWGKSYPTLCEFLTLSQWEDGSPRVPGTAVLCPESGAWKLCLRDRDGGNFCFVSGKTPTDLLEAVERGLTGKSTLDWRADRPQRKR
jgi:hypothetical protein